MSEQGPIMPVSNTERIVLGTIGGALVGATSFPIASGYGDIINGFDIGIMSGFAVRLLFFGFLGALWAYVHDDETSKRKTFELGLVAPAMIASLVLANAPPAAQVAKELTKFDGIGIVSTAYAQEAPKPLPMPTDFTSRFIKGLLGK